MAEHLIQFLGEGGDMLYPKTKAEFVEGLDYELSQKTDNVIISSNNQFNKNSTDNVVGYAIGNGGTTFSSTNYRYSHPIPLKSGQKVHFNKLRSGTYCSLFIDSENVGSGYYAGIQVGGGSATDFELVNSTDNLLYLRISYHKDDASILMVNYGDTLLPYDEFSDSVALRTSDIEEEWGSDSSKVLSQNFLTNNLKGLSAMRENLVSEEFVSQVYNITQGTAFGNHTIPCSIPAGKKFSIYIDYPEGNIDVNVKGYLYNSGGTYEKLDDLYANEKGFVFVRDFDVVRFGINLSANMAVATGTLQVTIKIYSEYTKTVDGVSRMTNKSLYRFSDAVYHWMNGEKFPIVFIGDSTTDGVGTTGWSNANSHYQQDADAAGRGSVDYICELAYPKQLENLLRAEFGSSTLRVYNDGYSGIAMSVNIQPIYRSLSFAYSDAKMAGLVLGINNRGSSDSPADYYNKIVNYSINYVEMLLAMGITPFMVTNQAVTQNGNNPSNSTYNQNFENHTQILCNQAKKYVAQMYGLEVIDLNSFGRLLFKSSKYNYENLTEDLHFKDLGHKLEAGYIFSEIIPWVNKSDDAEKIYFGFNVANNKTGYNCGKFDTNYDDVNFKTYINTTKSDTTDTLIFDAYLFNNSKFGLYTVKYLTPVASGYIVIDGDTSNPIAINSTEMNLADWDIGLHHVQVYTGASTTVAFKGFLLEKKGVLN